MSMTMSLPMTMCIPHQPVAMRLPPRDMSDVCGYESVASRHQIGEHQETSTGAALLVAETGTEPVAAIDIVACDATMAAGEEVVVNVDKIEVASPAGLATMGAACDTLPQYEVVACQGELLCALRDNRSNERKRNRGRARAPRRSRCSSNSFRISRVPHRTHRWLRCLRARAVISSITSDNTEIGHRPSSEAGRRPEHFQGTRRARLVSLLTRHALDLSLRTSRYRSEAWAARNALRALHLGPGSWAAIWGEIRSQPLYYTNYTSKIQLANWYYAVVSSALSPGASVAAACYTTVQ